MNKPQLEEGDYATRSGKADRTRLNLNNFKRVVCPDCEGHKLVQDFNSIFRENFIPCASCCGTGFLYQRKNLNDE